MSIDSASAGIPSGDKVVQLLKSSSLERLRMQAIEALEHDVSRMAPPDRWRRRQAQAAVDDPTPPWLHPIRRSFTRVSLPTDAKCLPSPPSVRRCTAAVPPAPAPALQAGLRQSVEQ